MHAKTSSAPIITEIKAGNEDHVHILTCNADMLLDHSFGLTVEVLDSTFAPQYTDALGKPVHIDLPRIGWWDEIPCVEEVVDSEQQLPLALDRSRRELCALAMQRQRLLDEVRRTEIEAEVRAL